MVWAPFGLGVVDCVIADNPGCLTHLRGGLDTRHKDTRVRHLAEVLWESLEAE